MRREHDSTQLRRYVLGALTEDERAGIEREYFEHADVLDQVCAAEDDLIDDYLSDRLASDEHERFEQVPTWPCPATGRAWVWRARSGPRHQYQHRHPTNVTSA